MNHIRSWSALITPVLLLALAGCGGSDTDSVVPGFDPPEITTQPSNITVAEGQDATFTVVAVGVGRLTYQWRELGSGLPLIITGANGPSFTITAATVFDEGRAFDVLVDNPWGQARSNQARLKVNGFPVIVNEPLDVHLESGRSYSEVLFLIHVLGGDYVLQWQRSNDGGVSFADIAGANDSFYRISVENLHTADNNGARFRVVVSNAYGTVTSRAALLTMAPPVARLTFSTPAPYRVGQPIGLDTSTSTPGGGLPAFQGQSGIRKWAWDFDWSGNPLEPFDIDEDGTFIPFIINEWFVAGTYVVRVRITNDRGETAETSQSLTIGP